MIVYIYDTHTKKKELMMESFLVTMQAVKDWTFT